ncbi:hypothetical protein DB31_2818 [Hyalangium minutum]|uniref:Uncharacterized protein n=1 Tax=Hyalangium minutum TaxID=394096 RepID=A0A085W6B2_9BACT|nr:hypothetical protein DB31_2818 [Hyalangium minutum]
MRLFLRAALQCQGWSEDQGCKGSDAGRGLTSARLDPTLH